MRAVTPRSPGAPPGSRGLSHRDPHPEGGEVRSLLSALHSSARAAPAHPTTLSSPSPLLRSSGPHQLTPVRCPGKSDALYRDYDLRGRIATRLQHAGFLIEDTSRRLLGTNEKNICNRGASGMGVQLEISKK